MTSSQTRDLTRLTIWVAIGFGIGFALQGTILGAIPPPAIPSSYVHLTVTAILFALTGAVGGAVIGLTLNGWRNAGSLALAGAFGFALGYIVVADPFYTIVEEAISGYLVFLITRVVMFAVIGAIGSGLIGWVWRGWRAGGALSLAGAFGLGMGAIALEVVSNAVVIPIGAAVGGATGQMVHDSITSAISWAIAYSATGTIFGASLGVAIYLARGQPT